MKNFNLYILKHNLHSPENPTLIPIGASHQSTTSYPQGTYNEKLTNKPNSQAQLTFNISTTYNNNLRNRNADLMVVGQRLRLVFDNNRASCQDFFITKVVPTVAQNNTILAITAVDWFSYDLSHTGIGLVYDSLDHGGALTIQELVNDIIVTAKASTWKIDSSLVNSKVPRFYTAEDKIQPMRITFSVSGSNAYNALVEIAKKFDATIVPRYNWNGKGGMVDFINNNDLVSNLYHLSPGVNINTFGINQQSNNLCTIMYVNGGTDANGAPVTLTPQMHGAFKYWLLEHMCYDDDKKPGILDHNYPILITKKLNGLTYTYKKYKNTLYGQSYNRASNTKSTYYANLLATYDTSETIVFSLPISSSASETLVYVNNVKTTNFTTKIIDKLGTSVDVIEVRIPAVEVKLTASNSGTLWAGSDLSDKTSEKTATLNFVTGAWNEVTTPLTTVSDIWEAQNSMMDIYKLFIKEWNSVSATVDQGLSAYKQTDSFGVIPTLVYNYCNFIDNNVPSAGNFLYNFDYLLEKRLITPVEHYGLNYVLSHDVRNINLLINIYSQLYYELKYQFSSSLATITTYLGTFLGEIEAHKENINEVDNANAVSVNSITPISYNISNIVKETIDAESSVIIPIDPAVQTNDDYLVGLEYYETACYNKLAEILSSILREGLTAQFVRNCVTLYGPEFFCDTVFWLDSDPNFQIFTDTTTNFFQLLYEYDVMLNRSSSTLGTHDEGYDDDQIYDGARQDDANHILAKANMLRKQASYWYDNNNKIYMTRPTDEGTYYYHPNFRTVFLNLIKEFVYKEGSPYKSHLQQRTNSFNLVDYYESLIEEKDKLWLDINSRYGHFLLEGTYNDSNELTSTGLYNAALLNFSKINKPLYNYSVTSIDASQLVNTGTEDIKIGDRISIHHPAVFAEPVYNKTIVKIINDQLTSETTIPYLQYKIPQKGSTIHNFTFTRYSLSETNPQIDIYDQMLGSEYGENRGTILASDNNAHEFTVEWLNNWPVFGIDLINTLNYGSTLFFGDYSGIKDLAEYDSTRGYKAGEWFYGDEIDPDDKIGAKKRGHKVYQVASNIEKNTTLTDALKLAYRVDVYINMDSLDDLNDNELCVDSGKFGQKTTINSVSTFQEITSVPVYMDFVYEAQELILNITGTTQTLRENKTQLQVQDNSLINSLVDKLLYSVRFD